MRKHGEEKSSVEWDKIHSGSALFGRKAEGKKEKGNEKEGKRKGQARHYDQPPQLTVAAWLLWLNCCKASTDRFETYPFFNFTSSK